MMIFCTPMGTIEVLNSTPPPMKERLDSYVVLRRDGDEWTVSGEVINPAVLHVIAERWFPCLREAFEAIQRICTMYGLQRIYVVEDDRDTLAFMLH